MAGETRLFGDRDSLILPAEQAITLAQTRRSTNEVQGELVGSIRERGLLQAPTIALLGTRAFSTYLGFTQEQFGETRGIRSFRKNRYEGAYPLLIDGHSRLGAVLEIGNTDQVSCSVKFNLSDARTPDEIIPEQLAANIHSRPSRDQEAPAIAGAFAFARFLEPGVTSAEFCGKYGIQAAHLRDALLFVDLPDVIQDMVGSNGLPFSFSVSMAGHIEILDAYYRIKGVEDVGELVRNELLRFAMKYTEKKGVDAALVWLRSEIDGLKKRIMSEYPGFIDERADLFKGVKSGPIELEMFTEVELTREQRIRKELDDLIREQKSISATRASRIVTLTEETLALGTVAA